MDSWVYLFSRFTSEALYIQLFLILAITAGYCVYWVTHKRKHGAVDKAVPSSIVRTYLNELVSEAQLIRAQLFGLLADVGVPAGESKISTESLSQVAEKIASDPELAGKLKELQNKLSQQETAMTNIVSEKEQLEKELERIKAAQGSGDGDAPVGDGSDAEVVNNLKEKIKNLEDRLSEYSIIEDDLANLKKLQQENAELKAAMDGKEPPKTAEKPAKETKEKESPAAAPAEAAAEPTAESKPEEAKEADTGDQNFEGLVDKVEASLSEDAKPENTEEAGEQKASEEGSEEKKDENDPLSNVGKSDDDLLSEFEKMLNM